MSHLLSRWKLLLAGCLAWVAVAWVIAPDAHGQKDAAPKAKAKADPGTKATPLYYGVAACNNKGCHGGDPPKVWLKGKELLCRCDEANIWESSDKHGDAYKALTGERGKQMAKLLGYDVTKAKACLSCHAVWIDDNKLLAQSQEVQFNIEEGVNCVVCHGAYSEWVADHSSLVRAGKFRPLSRDEKWAGYGMKDLWDPLKRAELCASCHVGNLDQGKFVTHDMYAAGHPPLPGFEPATFSNEMPRHWEYLREKKPAVRKELGHREGELEETHLVLVGAAIALREQMRLMAADARAVKPRDAIDLAHFDCYACHHDLKSPSWRQERGYGGRKPGRIPMRPWTLELARLAVSAGKAERATFDKLVGELHKVFDARPYGDAAEVEKAAGALGDFADALAQKLNRAPAVKAEQAAKLLGSFGEVFEPERRLLDYDSARQIAWAYRVIRRELLVKNDAKKLAEAEEKVTEELKGLDALLRLRLPTKKEGLEKALPDTLKRIAEYDPRDGRELLRKLPLK